jgi:hypothetical protein
MTYLENVFDYAKTLDNIELELKLAMESNIRVFARQIIEYFQNPIISQSINFIKSCDKSYIKTLYFVNGIQQKEAKKYEIKTHVHTPIFLNFGDFPKFKLSISQELPSTESEYDAIDIDVNCVRFKYRLTYLLSDKWHIDLTFTKTLNTQDLSIIKNIKCKMFTDADYLSDWFWDYIDVIEIECEFIGTDYELKDLTIPRDLMRRIAGNTINTDKLLPKLWKMIHGEKIMRANSTLKHALPKPIELNKRQYFDVVLPNITNYWITDKADGIRTILILNEHTATFHNLIENGKFEIESKLNETIIECEKIDDKFYAFDILMYDGHEVINYVFEERLKYLKRCEPYCMIKDFVKLTADYSQEIYQFMDICKARNIYNIDGLIFTEDGKKYNKTSYYKWKPMEHMTIDFIAKKCPNELLGIYPYEKRTNKTLYLLFCGITGMDCRKMNLERIPHYNKMFSIDIQHYFPIQFTPSDAPYAFLFWSDRSDLGNKIVELNYLNPTKEWNLLRVRDDLNDVGYFGNNFKVNLII